MPVDEASEKNGSPRVRSKSNAANLAWEMPYTSGRTAILGRNMVAASQPLAAQAGLRILLSGGNAVDAALATAICQVIVEPNSTAMGGDSVAMVWHEGRMTALNATGRSPAAW